MFMQRLKLILFFLFLIRNVEPMMAQPKLIEEDYNKIQAGISYKEMVNNYGDPSFVFDSSKGNFFWFEYKINENVTYHFWCGTSENVMYFTIISDNITKEIFYDCRILSESETKENQIYFLPLGIQKSKILKLFGSKNMYVNKIDKSLAYKISNNEYAKLYFTNTQKLWKISKIINNHERKWCMDIRILE